MRITVKVKPRAREEIVERLDNNNFIVRVKAAPTNNQANEAVVRAVARYFRVAPSTISIERGHSSRRKLLGVPDF